MKTKKVIAMHDLQVWLLTWHPRTILVYKTRIDRRHRVVRSSTRSFSSALDFFNFFYYFKFVFVCVVVRSLTTLVLLGDL